MKQYDCMVAEDRIPAWHKYIGAKVATMGEDAVKRHIHELVSYFNRHYKAGKRLFYVSVRALSGRFYGCNIELPVGYNVDNDMPEYSILKQLVHEHASREVLPMGMADELRPVNTVVLGFSPVSVLKEV